MHIPPCREKYRVLGVALTCLITSGIFADAQPIGIIGGQGDAPYAALLYEDGSVQTVQGLPPTGLTYRVGINSLGEGLIGGTNGLNAYAAFVSPNGLLTPVQGLIAPGEIYTVAINNSSLGIIGGGHFLSNTPYAALVTPNGVAAPFSGLPANGLIYSVAIDPSGDGIIGGAGNAGSAYAAITSTNGTLSPIAGLPTTGTIFWVSTNASRVRFIGGADSSSAYAAFITPNGTLNPLTNLPLGQTYSVGINAGGSAIMGGTSLTLPYAALVAPNGTVKTVTGLPSTPGIIYTVAINDSGTGLLAGFSAEGPYGTFVALDGSLTLLKGLPVGAGPLDFLDGAALHPSGIALVGGEVSGAPFAALVAPNGNLTYLSGLPTDGAINSTALSLLNELVPEAVGPFDSLANTQFNLSNVLTQHCIIHHKYLGQLTCQEEFEFSPWIAIFGNYTSESRHDTIPSYSNQMGGVLLGLDYRGEEGFVIGGGVAYTYNCVQYQRHADCTPIHQESAVLYASWDKPYLYVNAALWGGAYQASHSRRSFPGFVSKARPTGWNLSPHLELSSPFFICQKETLMVDPFVALDWVHFWQSSYHEQGSSGFNLHLNDQYGSIFRTEVGCRFYSLLQCAWGSLCFEEKLSYVNRSPTSSKRSTAGFIGASSTFDVVTLNPSALNLGSVQIHVEYLPIALNDIYLSLDYLGEYGPCFESHLGTFTLGKNF